MNDSTSDGSVHLTRYEASFLVLGCNPIEDFNCVEKIQLRIKQGHLIEMADN